MVIVIAILGLGVLAMSIMGPILPLYLTSIDVTPAVLGLLLSTGMVGMAFGEVFWGWAADKTGMKLPFYVGTFVCALAVLLIVLTPYILVLFAAFFLWGLVRSALFGPGRGYIGTYAPTSKKATFMGIFAVVLATSRSIGALPSGFIAEIWGYRSVFVVSAGISLMAGLLLVLGFKKIGSRGKTTASGIKPSVEILQSSHTNFSLKSLSAQCVVTSLRFLGLGALIAFLPLMATEVIGVGATEVGILLSVGGVTSVLLGIPVGMIADKFGKKALMVIGLTVSALAMAGIAYSQSYLSLMGFVIANSVGMIVFSPAAMSIISDSVPLEKQSTAMGFYGGVCENSGIIIGSALGGFIWSTWGPQATFLMGAISSGIGVVVCIAWVKERLNKAM